MNNDYHFITRWRVRATVDEVVQILGDAQGLTRWWPSVYLDVQELEPGDERGVGKVIDLYTKGWLPYTLRWKFRVVEIGENRLKLEAWGDFVGRGIWTLTQDGDDVLVEYDWKVRADKPLLRRFSGAVKPIFSANHHWAMRQGEISLNLELARRRATTPAALARIPSPPGPTTTSSLPLMGALMLVAGATALAVTRLRSRRAS